VVRATVVTIRTTLQPENTTSTHEVVIAGNLARWTNDLDAWHLFDTKGAIVTLVDDLDKTVRREPLATITSRHRGTITGSLPGHYPHLTVRRTGARRTLLGLNAEQILIETGTYRRELWLAGHPAIPANLFGMSQAADMSESPLAPMSREVDELLMSASGFPLVDH